MIGTARVLWVTYLAFTLLAFVAYFAIPGLSFFEAVNHALTTAPTGGFSTSDASLSGTVSDAHIATVEWVAIVLMFIAGFNMALLVMAWDQRSLAPMVQDEEARGYTVIVVTIATLVCLGVLLWARSNTEEAPIRSGLFTVAAIVTSTGYVAADYNVADGRTRPHPDVDDHRGECGFNRWGRQDPSGPRRRQGCKQGVAPIGQPEARRANQNER